ncbi:hypothetical protein PPL_08674 [Heterostelium album PN500]|uniref:Uncharacterized protein n=1 Tax=Heterostelium pallidum (strain ATCC 26659 / Pp 5 / PN500) TaxID=670386 RepID=D3BJE9_HETP5|nr:hypothetical protein PPL_08674 [Heterostelium album PN500]EFA78029.1 hypothetical protein PPL_08674 [Heterostelium album PN500]|eukprot:XP_020430157.1 hypothetical protein PPL_08674 [Heterostelium album PN500]
MDIHVQLYKTESVMSRYAYAYIPVWPSGSDASYRQEFAEPA